MKRLTENGEAADVKECMAKSVKTVFGLDLSDEELEASLAKPEQPEASSGESLLKTSMRLFKQITPASPFR